MKSKHFNFLLIMVSLIIAVFAIFPFKSSADNESQCVECHTSAGKLINITREIAKTNPEAVSTFQEGEG
jgi:hypothetical protein